MKNEFVFLTIILMAGLISASYPVQMPFQLTDIFNSTSGNLLTIGDIAYMLYIAKSGGDPTYNETFLEDVRNGTSNIKLGGNTSKPFALEYMKLYYYDIEINGDNFNFTDDYGNETDRDLWYSPLGDINASKWVMNKSINESQFIESINLTNGTGYNRSNLFGDPLFYDNMTLAFTRIDDLNTTADGLYTNISTAYTRIDDLNTTIGDLQAANVTMNTRGDDLNTTIGDLQTENITSNTRIDDLNHTRVSAGMYDYPVITDHDNGSVTMGVGMVYLYLDKYANGTLLNFSVASGQLNLTVNTTSYVVVNYNSGSPVYQLKTNSNDITHTNIIGIYTLIWDGNNLHTTDWGKTAQGLPNKILDRLINVETFTRESGLAVSEFGANRSVAISSGIAWHGTEKINISFFNSSIDDMWIYYHLGGAWTNTTSTIYNNSNYDDGTDLQATSNNKYVVNWVYRGIEIENHTYITLGTDDYTLSEAIDARPQAPLPSIIEDHALLVGKIIVEEGASTAYSVETVSEAPFAAFNIPDHNDLPGIQGGTTAQYFHLTSEQYTNLTNLTMIAANLGNWSEENSTIRSLISDLQGANSSMANLSLKNVSDNMGNWSAENSTIRGFISDLQSANASQNNLSLSNISDNLGNWSEENSTIRSLISDLQSANASQNNLSLSNISDNLGNWTEENSTIRSLISDLQSSNASQNNLSLSNISENLGNWSEENSTIRSLISDLQSANASQSNLSYANISDNMGNWSEENSTIRSLISDLQSANASQENLSLADIVTNTDNASLVNQTLGGYITDLQANSTFNKAYVDSVGNWTLDKPSYSPRTFANTTGNGTANAFAFWTSNTNIDASSQLTQETSQIKVANNLTIGHNMSMTGGNITVGDGTRGIFWNSTSVWINGTTSRDIIN